MLAVACGGGEPTATGDDDASPADRPEIGAEGTEPTDGEDPEAADGTDLSGASLTVGSKEFTEQLILGQITIQALEAAGATVEDQTGLVGSTTVREALLSGEIDMYWEYTGTGWITH
ncbi:MAG: hypothetical protein KY460_17040, partial [Actinobacteria bacterium]|nr:hypothetical protein [Actinomycetota bacterium]